MQKQELEKFQQVLKDNFNSLSGWIKKEKIEAYRVYDKEIRTVPIAIDIYGNRAHIQIYDDLSPVKETELIEGIVESVHSVLNIPKEYQYFKIRKRQKEGTQYEKISADKERFIIKENGAKLYVNLKDYLDTGLFLDHRKTREFVAKEFADKTERMLNLFSYTASFSVIAAKAGVRFTTSVDMSNTYTNWAKDNFNLNNLPKFDHLAIRDNVMFFLENIKESWMFDLIVIDPPTFSRSKKMLYNFDIQRDHPFLINHCLEHLREDGTILFSNNFTKFKINSDALHSSNITDITEETIPPDFKNKKIHNCFLIKHGSK